MAQRFKSAGKLFRHGQRLAGRIEVTDPDLRALLEPWVGLPTEPYIYDNASTIAKGNRFLSFERRIRRNPNHLDGFVVTKDLLVTRIAWGDTAVSKELNTLLQSILGLGRCEVEVDIDYVDGGRGVIAIRRPDAVAVELGQHVGSSKFAGIVENTRQYRTPSEARR